MKSDAAVLEKLARRREKRKKTSDYNIYEFTSVLRELYYNW